MTALLRVVFARRFFRNIQIRHIALAAGLALLAPPGADAQTTEQLVKGATDTANVLNYGMGYNLQRFSPLTQINKDNAKNLVPVWNYSLADDRAEESQPIVYQGVLYVTTHNATMAVDAKTGKQLWKTKVEYPPTTCSGPSRAATTTPRCSTCAGSTPTAPPTPTPNWQLPVISIRSAPTGAMSASTATWR